MSGAASYNDIIIIARDVWGDVRRRRHFLAKEWSANRRILFVEPTVSIPAALIGREKGKLAGGAAPREVESGIYAMPLLKFLPNSIPGARRMNLAAAAETIRSASARLKLKNPVLWITAEYGVHFINRVPHSICVYDVTDDWTHATVSDIEKKQIIADDAMLTKQANIVITVSLNLHTKKKLAGCAPYHVPNGVKLDLYDNPPSEMPIELKDIAGAPIVGYAGSLHDDRLDIDLICRTAELSAGRYTQAFIGPDSLTAQAREKLAGTKGVAILPSISYDRLPMALHSFAVCSIPHLATPFTNSLDPIKVYEYLATGNPIVSTPVDGIKHLLPFIYSADSPRKYHEAIMTALEEPRENAKKRLDESKNHSWAERARLIDAIIQRESAR